MLRTQKEKKTKKKSVNPDRTVRSKQAEPVSPPFQPSDSATWQHASKTLHSEAHTDAITKACAEKSKFNMCIPPFQLFFYLYFTFQTTYLYP